MPQHPVAQQRLRRKAVPQHPVVAGTQIGRASCPQPQVAVRLMLPNKLEPLPVVVAVRAEVAAKKMRVPVKKILDIVGSVLRLVVPLVRKKKDKEK